MYFPTILTLAATLATTTFASPTAEASPELAARATKCIPGQVYCGWWLIDQQGWKPQDLRISLCDNLGKCDFNNGDAWNSLWLCNSEWEAAPKAVCGGKGACAGPSAHCV